MKLNLLCGDYFSEGPPFTGWRMENFLPIIYPSNEVFNANADTGDKSGYQGVIYKESGKTPWAICGGLSDCITSIFSDGNYLYWILRQGTGLLKFYRSKSSKSEELLSLGVSIYTDLKQIEVGELSDHEFQIYLGSESYIFNTSASTLTKITDTDFVGADNGDAYSGYSIVTKNGYFNFNDLTSYYDWPALNTVGAGYKSNPIINVKVLKEEVLVFTPKTLESFYLDGTSPFSKRAFVSSEIGLAAKKCVQIINDTCMFLGKNKSGQKGIYVKSQEKLEELTPKSYQVLLNKNYTDDAYCCSYVDRGQTIWLIILPTANLSIAINVNNGIFTKKTFLEPVKSKSQIFDYNYTDINCACEFKNKFYVGSNRCGLVSVIDENEVLDYYSYYDNSGTLQTASQHKRSLLQTATFSQEQRWLTLGEVNIEYAIGQNGGYYDDPTVNLQFSQDGGKTFKNISYVKLPAQGKYKGWLKKSGLGRAKNWSMKLVVTDPIPFTISNIELYGSLGVR